MQSQLEAGLKYGLQGFQLNNRSTRSAMPTRRCRKIGAPLQVQEAFLRVPISSRCSDPAWVLSFRHPRLMTGSLQQLRKDKARVSHGEHGFSRRAFSACPTATDPPTTHQAHSAGPWVVCWAIAGRVLKSGARQAVFLQLTSSLFARECPFLPPAQRLLSPEFDPLPSRSLACPLLTS